MDRAPVAPDSGTFGLTLSQQIWDFGQGQIAWSAAGAQVVSQHDTALATLLTVDYDVRSAYFATWGDDKRVGVAQEGLDDQLAHQRQIQAAVQIGTRPPSDLAQVQAGVASARVQLIDAQDAAAIAEAQLAQAMGTPLDPDLELPDDSLPPVSGEDQPVDRLVHEALARRPDRLALDQQLRSERLTLQATGLSGAPRISGSANLSSTAQGGQAASGGWSAGLTMAWPLVQGGAVLARSAEARATFKALVAQRDSLDLQIRLDVTQAELALRGATAGVAAAQIAVNEARVSLKLADGRYAVGLGSIVELTDAQQQLTIAEGQQIQERVQLDDARAALLKALGRS